MNGAKWIKGKGTPRFLALLTLLVITVGASASRNALDNVREIRIDVSVSDKRGNPVLGLERRNFRVFVDGVEQTVTRVATNSKPLAVVVLLEFRNTADYAITDVIEPALGLINSLRSEDWIALVPFNAGPDIAVDFTHDKATAVGALRRLQMPADGEAALYDSVHYVLGRMAGLEEKGVILLVGSGLDNASSRRTYGDALRRAESGDTMIYTIWPGRVKGTFWTPYPDSYSYSDPSLQFRLNNAAGTLASFADVSGGLSFEPLFPGQYRDIYETVNADLRHQYSVTFVPSNAKTAGKLRKLRVEVTGTDIDEDDKADKLIVRHKNGYY